MGKSNASAREYIAQKEHVADIFNNHLFQGEEMIRPEDLEAIDGQNDILLDDKLGEEQEVHRYRDIIMKWKYGINFMILACENQQKINYAMSVRNMLYDSLSYVSQIKEIWNRSKDKKMTSEEYLSKFRKEDKLTPVITIVLYYGLEKWDASLELYDMFKLNEKLQKNETIQQYIPNYKINLMDVGNLESVDKFRTDLQIVFGMLKYRSNTEKLMKYVKEYEEFYKNLDVDTYRAIREFLHSEKKLKEALSVIEEEEESVNMCKALDDLYNMGVEKGRQETEEKMCKALEDLYQKGIQKGKEDAEYQKLEELVRKMLRKGWSVEKIADTFDESLEFIQKIIV